MTRSETDAELIEILGLRIDLPLKFLRDLLSRATQAVRARLLALASPELQEEIKRSSSRISRRPCGRKCATSPPWTR